MSFRLGLLNYFSMPNYASIPSSDKDIRDHLPAPLRRLAYEKDVVQDFQPGSLILDKETSANHVAYLISGSAGVVLRNEDSETMSRYSWTRGHFWGHRVFYRRSMEIGHGTGGRRASSALIISFPKTLKILYAKIPILSFALPKT